MGVPFSQMLATGGGTSPLRRQMLADLYGCPVVTIDNKEGPALGAAILAGVGAGVFPNVQDACKTIIKANAPQRPIEANTSDYEPYYTLYRELHPALKEQFKTLSTL